MSLLAVALIFFSLGAPFVAALEVIIYAGAIMVLFIFVIMMLNLGGRAAKQECLWLRPGSEKGPALLCGIMAAELIYFFLSGHARISAGGVVQPKEIGIALFGPYALGVELASMLLLSGLVGAYHLGRPKTITSATETWIKQCKSQISKCKLQNYGMAFSHVFVASFCLLHFALCILHSADFVPLCLIFRRN